MTQARIGDWMQTISGRAYWPLSPQIADVSITDIAHALSMICRFGGHTSRFYSVAEHSVLVSRCVPPEHALQALLHDATEAYVGDVVRPLKQNLTGYDEIEDRNWAVIAQQFGVPYVMHPSVKDADNAVLLAEKAALLKEPPIAWHWAQDLKPAAVRIWWFNWPWLAKWRFLRRYKELTRAT